MAVAAAMEQLLKERRTVEGGETILMVDDISSTLLRPRALSTIEIQFNIKLSGSRAVIYVIKELRLNSVIKLREATQLTWDIVGELSQHWIRSRKL